MTSGWYPVAALDAARGGAFGAAHDSSQIGGGHSTSLGYRNELATGIERISMQYARRYVTNTLMKANDAYWAPSTSPDAYSVAPREWAVSVRGVNPTANGAAVSHLPGVFTNLAGLGAEAARRFAGSPELIEEAIMSELKIHGLTEQGIQHEETRHGTTSAPLAVCVAGIRTVSAIEEDFPIGALVELKPFVVTASSQKPNGVPVGKVILRISPVADPALSFARIFKNNLRMFLDKPQDYRQYYQSGHSQSGASRVDALQTLEDVILTIGLAVPIAVAGFPVALRDADDEDTFGINLKHGALTDKQQQRRQWVMERVFAQPKDLAKAGIPGANPANRSNQFVMGGRPNTNTWQGRLLEMQLNLADKLASCMGQFHRIQQQRIVGKVVGPDKNGGGVDIQLK